MLQDSIPLVRYLVPIFQERKEFISRSRTVISKLHADILAYQSFSRNSNLLLLPLITKTRTASSLVTNICFFDLLHTHTFHNSYCLAEYIFRVCAANRL
jgi:hypothetical protein